MKYNTVSAVFQISLLEFMYNTGSLVFSLLHTFPLEENRTLLKHFCPCNFTLISLLKILLLFSYQISNFTDLKDLKLSEKSVIML